MASSFTPKNFDSDKLFAFAAALRKLYRSGHSVENLCAIFDAINAQGLVKVLHPSTLGYREFTDEMRATYAQTIREADAFGQLIENEGENTVVHVDFTKRERRRPQKRLGGS